MTYLGLDLSTNSTGWAIIKNDKLYKYGVLKAKVKGISKLKYPWAALYKMLDLAWQIKELVETHNPDLIVIEEVNRGKNRISQKSLDALHFFVLHDLCIIDDSFQNKVVYMDSNGKKGWRGVLGLALSDQDKAENKNIRNANKKSKVKKDVINWKTLSVRYVSNKYGIKLSTDNDPGTDGDIADAICLLDAYIKSLTK